MIHVITWMNPVCIMLSEKKPVTEDHILHDSIYTKYPEKRQIYRTESD